MATTVVLVHGLYMNRLWLQPLKARLRARGYAPECFAYATVTGTPAAAAERLAARLVGRTGETVHLVGHSLGGLVIRHLLARAGRLPPGRVVTVGTPHRGSRVAAAFERGGFGWILGGAREQALLGGAPPWDGSRELGSIAGERYFGLGAALGLVPRPADGIVTVDETRLDGMRDHVVLPHAHIEMLFAEPVARQIDHFLRTGAFNHAG